MPLLPSLKAMFEAQQSAPPMPTDLPPAQMRASIHTMIEQSYLAFSTAQDPVRSEQDYEIAVADSQIRLRVYRDESAAPLPCHIYFHGGGFFLGTLDHSEGQCRALARRAECVVISVDYRLAPEHPFPTASEDAYAALLWIADNASTLNIDPTRISVGGGSAGGNLAAVVALMARDRAGPAIIAQVLEIPVTDFTHMQVLDFPEEGISISPEKIYTPLYLGNPEDARNPYASPLLAASHRDLPPALVMCAEYDQLQPEGEAYARRLEASGVSTTYCLWQGQFHGSQNFDKIIPVEAAAYRDQIVSFLRAQYGAKA